MKKITYAAVAFLTVAFASCSSKAGNAEANIETETEVTEAIEEAPAAPVVAVDTVGYTTTPSGLQYKEIKAGTGNKPAATDVVSVHYTGKHLNGETFDSSVERGEPTSFPLNRVIAGWTEGVQLMKVGAKYQFIIPANLAYGSQGTPGGPIAPDETLYFEVELLGIEK